MCRVEVGLCYWNGEVVSTLCLQKDQYSGSFECFYWTACSLYVYPRSTNRFRSLCLRLLDVTDARTDRSQAIEPHGVQRVRVAEWWKAYEGVDGVVGSTIQLRC